MTLASVVNQVRQTFPELSQSRIIGYANTIHARICMYLDIRHQEVDINMTDGTADYDLPDELARIYAVTYRTSATSVTHLEATTMEKMDYDVPDWRTTSQEGTPSKFLIRSKADGSGTGDTLVITLYPTPDTTTASGYPHVSVWLTESKEFSATTDNLPVSLIDERVYVSGIKMLYAEDNALDTTAFFTELYLADLARCKEAEFDRVVNEPASRAFPYARGKRTI